MNQYIKIVVLLCIMTINTNLCRAFSLDMFKGKHGSLDIAGGTAHIPVMKQAAKNIMEMNPEIKITVTGGGTGVGIQKVGEGLVQIGNTGRPIKDEEVKKYGLVSYPFSIDGVAIIINPKNSISALSTKQIQDIFSGKVTSWKYVGGKNVPIHVYMREDGSGTREIFEEKALKNISISKNVTVFNSNGSVKMAVAKDSNAIGYIGVGFLDTSVKGVVFEGVYPSQENVSQGLYTVSRFLYMNTKGEPSGLTKLFIEYIYSSEGRSIIRKAGYIPIEKE